MTQYLLVGLSGCHERIGRVWHQDYVQDYQCTCVQRFSILGSGQVISASQTSHIGEKEEIIGMNDCR